MSEQTPGHVHSRPCPYCEGVGCEECDQTGQRVATIIDFDGGTMRVSGSAVLSSEDVAALQAIAKAAHDRMAEEA